MRRWLVGWVVWSGGCLDKNPDFIDTTVASEAPGSTGAPAATDTQGETGSIDPEMPTSTTAPISTSGPDTEAMPVTEGSTTTGAFTDTGDSGATMGAGYCGDGEVGPDELCDDGNIENGDKCPKTCQPAICGDGFVLEDVEACDDGNMSDLDDCHNDCTPGICGDGFLKPGEICDDGNLITEDGCDIDCVPTTKIVFVTSKAFTGAIGGLLKADEECNNLAGAAGLQGIYMAWLSTTNQSPNTRMTKAPFPYVRADGSLIAQNWDQLVSGMLAGPVGLTEKGEPPFGAQANITCGQTMIHTNTTAKGDAFGIDTDCMGWTGESGLSNGGSFKAKDLTWTDACKGDICHILAPIYCVEQ